MSDGPDQTADGRQDGSATTGVSASGDPGLPESGWEGGSEVPVAEVQELFITLGKTLRAYQLYDQNNPVYQRFVAALRSAFARLWEEAEKLTVRVGEEALTAGGTEVYRAANRSDSLAFLFFKDGVRELTFLPGVENGELTRFLSVLQRARNVRQDGDDLLTILWEEDLEFLRYQYVDMLAEDVDVPEPGAGGTAEELQAVLQSETEEGAAPEETEEGEEAGGPASPRPDDFNPTLYSLDPRELQQLREELANEMSRNLREDVLNALFDRLEEPANRERQSEILGIFHQLLPNFLSRGALHAASRVLGELADLEGRDEALDADGLTRVARLLDQLSTGDAIAELVRALEEGTVDSSADDLAAFLSHLRSEALAPLIRASETVENDEMRPILQEAVQEIADASRPLLLAHLEADDAVVAAGAARLVGRMRIAEAGGALAESMRHPIASVRLAAVEAALDLRASTAAGALAGRLDDPDRDVRIAAARALGVLRYRPAARALHAAVTGKEIREADLTEKLTFFESYGLLAGEAAVEELDRLLNGRSFLGRREPAEIRACAARALGVIGSADAQAALRAASDEEDPVVRNAVSRALQAEG